MRCGDHRLPHARDALCKHLASARGRARRARRRAGAAVASAATRPPRAAATAPRAAARPASRTGAGRDRRSMIDTSSRCGPSPVAPRSRSRSSRRLERLPRRRLGVVAERAPQEGRAPRHARRRRAPGRPASRGDARRGRPRATRPAPSTARARLVPTARTARAVAQRCAGRAPRGSPAAPPRAPGTAGPSTRSK